MSTPKKKQVKAARKAKAKVADILKDTAAEGEGKEIAKAAKKVKPVEPQ